MRCEFARKAEENGTNKGRLQLAVALGMFAGAAQAVPLLDASYDPGNTFTVYAGIDAADFAQTFTVQSTGILSSIDLLLDNAAGPIGDLLIDVRRTVGGVPVEDNADVLMSVAARFDDIGSFTQPSWFNVDTSSFGIRVTTNDVLAVVLRHAPGSVGNYLWAGRYWQDFGTPIPDPYVSGEAFMRAPFNASLASYPDIDVWRAETQLFSDGT